MYVLSYIQNYYLGLQVVGVVILSVYVTCGKHLGHTTGREQLWQGRSGGDLEERAKKQL